MFRVPNDPDNPTYDDVRKVSFWGWLTSKKADRLEWRRRRNAAIPTMKSVRKMQQVADDQEAASAEYRAARDAREKPPA